MRSAKLTSSASCSDSPPNPDLRLTDLYWPESPPPRTSQRNPRNVMGEIRGSEKPEEVVVLGGHIDSWDIGQGANDDGSGIMATFQAVALMKKLGLRPRRTIRVCFWVNEENGGAGGRAYRKMVGDGIANHVAAIEVEGGAEKPVGFGFG